MSEKLTKAPIFYTTAQIRFNPIMEMADHIARFQKTWRSGYPDFSMQAVNQLQFQLPGLGQQPQFKASSLPRWHFKNTEQTSGFILSTDSIIYHTTEYDSSAVFFKNLIDGLTVVNETVPLAYVETVAMRTLDAILPNGDVDLSFFLKDHLLGLFSQLGGTLKHSVSELVLTRQEEQLSVRVALLNGNLGMAADLVPMTLKIRENLQTLNCVHAVLDNDCIQRKRFPFDISKTAETLRSVKSRISDAFKKSVTEEAIAHWR
jgi:uncharacterized protein (TIGR04255 family)